MGQRFEIHPAAALFPLLEGPELEALKEDILRNGQMKPIELWENQVLDGRNRLLACELAGVAPKVQHIDRLAGTCPIAHVLSANLHRRHLNPSQLAMVGARARKLFDEEARKRRVHHAISVPENFPEARGDARDLAGIAVGVSGRSIDAATSVLKSGAPELVAACDRGELSVSRAAKLAVLPREAQQEVLRTGVKSGRRLLPVPAPRPVFPQPDLGGFKDILARADRLRGDLERQLESLRKALVDFPRLAFAVACANRLDALSSMFAELAQELRSGSESQPRSGLRAAGGLEEQSKKRQPRAM